jgi:hypothetical protein
MLPSPSMLNPRAIRQALVVVLLTMVMTTGRAASQTCTGADLAAVIDDMGAKLRATSMESYPQMKGRMRQLAAAKGWPEIDAEAKAQELLEDEKSRALDDKAAQLLIELDRGGPSETANPTCAQVAELKAIASQLLDVTRAKSAHALARLDAELGVKPLPVPAPVAKAPEAKPQETRPPNLKPGLDVKAAEAAAPKPPRSKPAQPMPWDTQTTPTAAPPAATLPPVVMAAPAPTAEELQFSVEDIRAAGRGFFGTVSAELAGVIEYAFKSYGRPTGYILGTEGGAALLAGLRYGEGTLVTKRDGERRIYWQGPSVGYDFGLAGSRTLVLVYNLADPQDMLARFGGVDGSAYLVGGVGLTLLKKGPIILAPIRTGLGLRVGANVGYLKFTSQPSFNPF